MLPQRKKARRARKEKGYEGKSERKGSKETKKESGVGVSAVKVCLLSCVSVSSGDSAVSQVLCRLLVSVFFRGSPFCCPRSFPPQTRILHAQLSFYVLKL